MDQGQVGETLQTSSGRRRVEAELPVLGHGAHARILVHPQRPGVDHAGVNEAGPTIDLLAVGALEGDFLGCVHELVPGPVLRRHGNVGFLEHVGVQVHAHRHDPQRPGEGLAVLEAGDVQDVGQDVGFVVGGEEVVNGRDQVIADELGQAVRRDAQHVDALAALEGGRQLGEALVVRWVARDFNFDVGVVGHELGHGQVEGVGELVARRVAQHP